LENLSFKKKKQNYLYIIISLMLNHMVLTFLRPLALLKLHNSLKASTKMSWPTGLANDRSKVEDLMDAQKSWLTSATPGGSTAPFA
jgi:hypothetical protein